ncbi:MAG TPA: head GIN domain-containing protein [Kofleriaceae bacterium]|jgi:hypothetical protein
MKTCVLLLLAGCSFGGFSGVAGSGTPKTELRPVTGFTAITVSGAIAVDIGTAGEPRVEIAGDDNLVPLITTEVTGSRLVIRNQKEIRPKVPLVIRIAAPQITELAVSGASSAVLHDVHADNLKLELDGASKLRADGAVHQLTLEAGGASDADLDQLAVERATVTVSGSSEAEVAVSKALDARAQGASSLTYRGDPPELKQDASGASKITKR